MTTIDQQHIQELLQMHGLQINHITVEPTLNAYLECNIHVHYQQQIWVLYGDLHSSWQWSCYLTNSKDLHAYKHTNLNLICQHIKHKCRILADTT